MDHPADVEALLEEQASVLEVTTLLEAKGDHSIGAHNLTMNFRQLTKLELEASAVIKKRVFNVSLVL
jgi:hypothetical protein